MKGICLQQMPFFNEHMPPAHSAVSQRCRYRVGLLIKYMNHMYL